MEGVRLDRWGYEVSTVSDPCISAINSYYLQVLSYGRQRSVILEAPAHDPNCVLANILVAHFCASSDSSRVPSFLEAAKSQLDQASLYEKAVFDAISYLISSNRDDDVALDLHFKLLKSFPKDLVSLKRGQVLAFYMGRPDFSLDLVEQVLPANQEEEYVHGMLAFPLLELGLMKEAEKASRKGFEINKEDPWAQHAVCHVLQFECRFREAIEFMEQCSKTWNPLSSFMITHNWWHVALCYLEGGSSLDKVREVYDQCIWKELERSDAVAAEVYLNAVGLLLRVYVRGGIHVFEDHLKTLADLLTDRKFWYLEWHLDLLALWALSCIEEFDKAEELLEGLKHRVSKMATKKQILMQRGLLLGEALYEYGKGNSARAMELLGPDFDANTFKMIGASDEQLDVFNEVWYMMLLSTGQTIKATEAIEKQLKKRGGAPFLWRLLEKSYLTLGKGEEASTAGKQATALETAYFYLVVKSVCA